MNREILFKAKRIDNGEWIEGDLYTSGRWLDVFNKDAIYIGNPELLNPIDQSTICRYTGFKDKNGKLIWENDICIIYNNIIDEKDGFFTIKWEDDFAEFTLSGRDSTTMFDNFCGTEYEVVGNIFDNPELLEEGAE